MSGGATVTVADILELRADGLAEKEIWSLLCQAVQTLQDLFLSEKLIKEEIVPFVSPHTLAINSKGRVVISLVREIPTHHEQYTSPEYETKGHRTFTNLDWEKMWIYSLGKTLSFSLKAAANHSSLKTLRFMTQKNPVRRASLMALLNIISDHCKTNLPMKPFTHMLMEMYREVFGNPPQCLLPVDTSDSIFKEPKEIFESFRPSFHLRKKITSRTRNDSFESNKTSVSVKRNPVQRAPSRLYRGPSARVCPMPSACIGPEFVVRGMEPLKTVHIGDAKPSVRKILTVIFLTGQRLRVTCDPSILCGKLFEVMVQVEEMEDNYMFGLACLIKGDFVFLPSEMKLHKIAPPGWKDKSKEPTPPFFLYVRVKFFLPSLRGVKSHRTRHFMYLQLRRSLLEQQIKCDLNELISLGGLALQAEFGNYYKDEHGTSSYFLLEHYLPEELIEQRPELEARLQENHKSRYGLDPARAEETFVAQVQRLPEYGSHHYNALWVRKSVSIPMWVTVNPQGVYLYEKKKNILDRKVHEAFVWKNIQGLNCNENYFHLVPHDVFGQKVTCYKLRMDNKKSFFLFRLASFHHQFFLKLRIELSPLHTLSREFGISFKKDNKNIFYLENKIRRLEWNGSQEEHNAEPLASCLNIEERQNNENENPLEKREKRIGVKMGVRAFHPKPDVSGAKLCLSEASTGSFDAYVVDSNIKCSDESFTYDFQESIPTSLADKFGEISWEEERILKRVRFTKDKYGSFGLEIMEGNNGGLFVENVLKCGGGDESESVQRGDQLLAVNGVCLLNLNYSEALNILKTTGDEMEILLSRKCIGDTSQKPLEREYLKNIRYETANETENLEVENPLTNGGLVFTQGGDGVRLLNPNPNGVKEHGETEGTNTHRFAFDTGTPGKKLSWEDKG